MNPKSIIIISLLFLVFSACKSKEKPVVKVLETEDYYEFIKYNFAEYGLNINMMLPDETANIGASTKPQVKHDLDGFKWEIEIGPNFEFIIDDFGEEKEKVSEKMTNLKSVHFMEVNYLVNEKDFIVYETKLKIAGEKSSPITNMKEHVSYHVYAQKTIDGYTYVFRSREEGFPKNIIEIMAKSFRSIKENKE
jgi:hypothetical protein